MSRPSFWHCNWLSGIDRAAWMHFYPIRLFLEILYQILPRWLIALFLTYDNDTIYICHIYSLNVYVSTGAEHWGLNAPTICFIHMNIQKYFEHRNALFGWNSEFRNVLCLNFSTHHPKYNFTGAATDEICQLHSCIFSPVFFDNRMLVILLYEYLTYIIFK